MEKVFGASERRDGIQQIGRRRWELFYGFGKDGDTGYNYRLTLEYKPTIGEIRQILIDQINANTDERILKGFVWKDHPVYLSSENQFNYKSAYDLALQDETILPIKFKLGEDTNGGVVYYTFETVDELKDFYTKAILHINQCLNEGWQEKDDLDMSLYE